MSQTCCRHSGHEKSKLWHLSMHASCPLLYRKYKQLKPVTPSPPAKPHVIMYLQVLQVPLGLQQLWILVPNSCCTGSLANESTSLLAKWTSK